MPFYTVWQVSASLDLLTSLISIPEVRSVELLDESSAMVIANPGWASLPEDIVRVARMSALIEGDTRTYVGRPPPESMEDSVEGAPAIRPLTSADFSPIRMNPMGSRAAKANLTIPNQCFPV